MFCKYCGNEIVREDAAFCPNCGKNVARASAPKAATPAPVPSYQAPTPAYATPAPAGYAPVTPQQRTETKGKAVIIGAAIIAGIALIAIVAFVFLVGNKTIKLDTSIIPDAEVRRVLTVYDANGDGELKDEELEAITSLAFDAAASVTIPDGFTNLETVTVTGTTATDVTIRGNGNCTEVSITDTPNVTKVDIKDMKNLEVLDLTNCNISEIDISGMPNLVKIILTGTNITKLDVSHNSKLSVIEGGENVVLEGLDKIGLKEYFVPTKVTVTNTRNNTSATFTSTYDENNRISTITYNTYSGSTALKNSTTTYSYDDKGRVTGYTQGHMSVNSPDSVATFTYDNDNRIVTSSLSAPGGQTGRTDSSTITYNGKGSVTGYTQTSTTASGSKGTVSYDANGSISSVTSGTEGYVFGYDNEKRITSYTKIGETGDSGTIVYDEAGRCTRIDHTYQVSKTTSNTLTDTYTYDENGRMTSATQQYGSGARSRSTSDMVRDVFGNLTKVTINNMDMQYVYTISYTRIICSENLAPLGSLFTSENPLDLINLNISETSYLIWSPCAYTITPSYYIFDKETSSFMTTGTASRMTYVEHKATVANTPAAQTPAKQEGLVVSNDYLELTLPASWADKVNVGTLKMDPHSGGLQEITMKDSGKVVLQIMVDPMGLGGFVNYSCPYNSEQNGHKVMIAVFSGNAISNSMHKDLVSPSAADSMLALTTGGQLNYEKASSTSSSDCDSIMKAYFDQTILPTLKFK